MAKKKETKKEKLERTYNIPLRRKFRNIAKHKKTPKAVRTIKEFLKKHMKADNIKLGMHLNEYLWKHGIRNPPHHAKVNVVKEDDVVKAELQGFKFKDAVKAEKKKEPVSMKEKLTAKLAGKEGATTEAEKTSEPPKTESLGAKDKPLSTVAKPQKPGEKKPEATKEQPKPAEPKREEPAKKIEPVKKAEPDK